MMNIIVLAVTAIAAVFVLVWLLLPQFRKWIELPKYRMLQEDKRMNETSDDSDRTE